MDVILHIGPHKTGSSSIQSTLRKNVESLAAQGILTANDAEHAASLLPLCFQTEQAFHPKMRRKYQTWSQAQAKSDELWSEVERDARLWPEHTMILSSEHFSSLADPSLLIARLRRTFSRIVVVGYVRDPVDLYVSSVQQNIRGGRRLADLRLPSDFQFGIRRQAEAYSAGVGTENVILRNFARSNLADGDVVKDFFDLVSKVARPVDVPSSFVNEAFPAPLVAWLLVLNETYPRIVETDERIALLRRLEGLEELKGAPKLRLDLPEFVAAIRTKTREDCLWLNQNHLQGQVQLSASPPDQPSGLTKTEERVKLRQWILGALTPEALSHLLVGTIALEKAEGRVPKHPRPGARPKARNIERGSR